MFSSFRLLQRGSVSGAALLSLTIFLPVGGYAIMRFHALGAGGALWQVVGNAAAVAIHAAIIVYALRRRGALAPI